MKVSLGIVHGAEIDGWHYHSIIGLLTKKNPTGHVLDDHVCVRSGPLLSAGRGTLVGQFLTQTDSDALFMLDSDMKFTPELIYTHIDFFDQCRQTYPDLGILGGLTEISSDPLGQVRKPNVWVAGKHPGQFYQVSEVPENALMEVGGTGAACLLISREVLEKFAGEKINPFHHVPLVNWPMLARNVINMTDMEQAAEEIRYAVWGADQCGEDMSFCMRVRHAGYRIFVHTGLHYGHSKSILLGEQAPAQEA